MEKWREKADQLIKSPCSSNWLKQGLITGICRDPVDAYSDALLTAEILKARMVKELYGKEE